MKANKKLKNGQFQSDLVEFPVEIRLPLFLFAYLLIQIRVAFEVALKRQNTKIDRRSRLIYLQQALALPLSLYRFAAL